MNNTLKIINISLNEINDYGHNFNTIQLTKSRHEEISQALQEKAERDKMRCENCKYFYKLHCTFGGLCKNRKLTDFCSYFKPKAR